MSETKDAPGLAVRKRSVTIAGHRTSLSLEEAFWRVLQDAAARRRVSLAKVIGDVDATRGEANLSSALRVFALDCVREQDEPGR